jgi:hypothetical protein
VTKEFCYRQETKQPLNALDMTMPDFKSASAGFNTKDSYLFSSKEWFSRVNKEKKKKK